MSSWKLIGIGVLGCWLAGGCSFEDRPWHCATDSECSSDRTCYRGFCLRATDTSGAEISSGGSRAAAGGSAGSKNKPMDAGAAGASGATAGQRAGTGGASGAGSGGSTAPTQSTDAGSPLCTGDATRPCTVKLEDAIKVGGCGQGLAHCMNGAWGTCTPVRTGIEAERCNKLDDDCDGTIDEDSNVECYPSGSAGCMSNANGEFSCKGICKAGVQRCINGNLGTCADYVLPQPKELCTTDAIDENCNGPANDGCMCSVGAMQDCYSGAAGTQGKGICTVGRQLCVAGAWGVCEGEVTAQAETCNGKDDDCDGVTDNVVGVGNDCTDATKKGSCSVGKLQCQSGNAAPQCVSEVKASPEACDGTDNDCNGVIDDVAPALLQSDPLHCGSCNKACGGDKCCNAQCVDTNTDVKNCGVCGKACGVAESCVNGMCMSTEPPDAGPMCDAMRPCASGELCCGGKCVPNDKSNCGTCGTVCKGVVPECCSDVSNVSNVCVDLSEPANCGKCGNRCPTLDGGLACTCATTGVVGTYECRNGTNACQ